MSRIIYWDIAKAHFVALYYADERQWRMFISQLELDDADRRLEVAHCLADGLALDVA